MLVAERDYEKLFFDSIEEAGTYFGSTAQSVDELNDYIEAFSIIFDCVPYTVREVL